MDTEEKRSSIYIKAHGAREWANKNISNLSDYVTTKILEDMKQEEQTIKEENADAKIKLYGSICFLFLGFTLLFSAYAYTVNSIFSVFNLIMVALALISCTLITFYFAIHINVYRRAKET